MNTTTQINNQLTALSSNLLWAIRDLETGGTFNFDSQKVNFIEGYLVGQKSPSLKINKDKFLELSYFELSELLKNLYFKANRFQYVGFWVNKGIVYIDLVNNILNKSQAIQAGLVNDQFSIWDCKNEVEINLSNYSNS